MTDNKQQIAYWIDKAKSDLDTAELLILTWLNSPMLCIGNLGPGFYPGVNTFYLENADFYMGCSFATWQLRRELKHMLLKPPWKFHQSLTI